MVKHVSKHKKGIDVLLKNRPRSFHKTAIFETGFSDHHKLILSVFRSYFIRILPKTIEYRNYKNFNETAFLRDLDQELLKGQMYKSNNEMYSTLTKELSKAIMNKSKIRNKYQKWPSRENFLALKEAKKFCNKLTKSVKKHTSTKQQGKALLAIRHSGIQSNLFLPTKVFLQMKPLL